jgi:hypothetical protein
MRYFITKQRNKLSIFFLDYRSLVLDLYPKRDFLLDPDPDSGSAKKERGSTTLLYRIDDDWRIHLKNGVNRSVGASDCGAGHSFVI